MKRNEEEAKFLKALVQELSLKSRPSYWIPIPDAYQTGKGGRKFSTKRPFDGILFVPIGNCMAIEAKYVKGETYNIERWVQNQPHQSKALWGVHRSGNIANLAVRFRSAKYGVVDRLFPIYKLVGPVGGQLVARRKSVGAAGA